MKTPALAVMIGNIQALFEAETGGPLAPALRNQLESILGEAIKGTVGLKREESFRAHEGTVMLTDLRGFTSISEQHSAPVLLEMLNRYLVRMTEIAVEHGGTIDVADNVPHGTRFVIELPCGAGLTRAVGA